MRGSPKSDRVRGALGADRAVPALAALVACALLWPAGAAAFERPFLGSFTKFTRSAAPCRPTEM